LQGNTIDDHQDLEIEPNQDEMNAMEEVEERFQEIENLFDQRVLENMEIDIGNSRTEGEDEEQDRIAVKEEEKDVKCIDAAGTVKDDDGQNE
jgi:hypothetical protein